MGRRRKGCRHCQYRYFETCCRYCNILELNSKSELLLFIVLFESIYKVRNKKEDNNGNEHKNKNH